MRDLILIGSGGAVGSILRWLLATSISNNTAGRLPWGTLTVNLLGCAMAGLLLALVERNGWRSESLRAFAFVGVLGGFTTFSAFGVETLELLRRGAYPVAAVYVITSVVGGIGLLVLAFWLLVPSFRPASQSV